MAKINKKKLPGVTLIELMAVISIAGILTSISVSLFFYFRKENDFSLAVWQAANSIREAEIKAKAAEEDSVWGVNIEQNKVTIFKGSSFLGRDQSFDVAKNISGVVGISGQNPIIINKFTGFPQNPGSVTLSSDSGDHSININEKGIVNY